LGRQSFRLCRKGFPQQDCRELVLTAAEIALTLTALVTALVTAQARLLAVHQAAAVAAAAAAATVEQ